MPTVSHKTATALLVAAALFMEILDATIITTALPIIAAEFGVPAAHLSVGVSAYLVAVTIFIPISGWAADRFGAKRIFSLAILIFVAASVLCGFSQSLTQFTVARVLQGIGGAMMVPVGRLVVLRNLPKEQIVNAMAILTWPALGAPLIGPVLGGWIAETWHWSWIFFINVPLGIIALLFAYWLLNNDKGQWQPFDVTGFLLSATGFGTLMAGLESFSARPDDILLPLLMVAGGSGILAFAIRHMLYASNPLFSLSALRFSTFRATMTGGSIIRISLSSAPFIIPLMLQVGLGYSAIEAGTLLLWLFAGNLAVKPATTWIMNTFGFKNVLIYNTVLVAAGFFVLALCDAQTSAWLLGIILFLSGMTRSMHLTVLNTLSFADVPQSYIRDANTLSAVIMQMTRGMGITAGALALALATFIIDDTRSTPVTSDFQLTMVFMGIIALISLVNSARVESDIGDAVLNHRRAR
ncbi:MFS transporter [Salinimonas sp. HHU 13199]|uniref:MFS transporter n=1 Tax=Salinimonas profundi TaxID=2729140 RepID=A0ABR8LIX8_9ALTE|nr:MFS transporter [Salinimonas profundi]MBD3586169.1 MFS transporter [Salinimonas profundi]